MTVKRGYSISTVCKRQAELLLRFNLVAYPFVQGQLHSPGFKISQSQLEIGKAEIDERSIFVFNQKFVALHDNWSHYSFIPG